MTWKRMLWDKSIEIVALFALILAGCARPTSTPSHPTSPQPEPTSTPQAAKAGPIQPACPTALITIRLDDWSNTDEAKAARDEVLSGFQEAYPCIKVEIVDQNQEGADAKRLAHIQAGTASDLIAVESSYIPAYTEAGGLADLTPFIAADPSFKPEEFYFQGVWKAGFYKGTPRAINKDFSTCAVYINVGMFEKAGIPIPEEGWTYDDYLKIAQQLTLDQNGRNASEKDFDPNHITQYGTSSPYWSGSKGWFRGFENRLYSFGAHAISPDATTTQGYLNSKNALHAWEFSRDLIHKYHVAPDGEVLRAQQDGNMSLFKEGKLAMVDHWGPWFQETLNAVPGLKWTVVPLPTGPAGHKGVIMWMGWGLNARSDYPQEAWALLKWLTTDPGQRAFTRRAMTQYKPLAVEYQRINDPFWGVFLAETEYVDVVDDATNSRFFPCVANGPTSEFLFKVWQPGGDQLDLQVELDRLATEADQCLVGEK